VLLPPNGDSAVVEFELQGDADEMLRVEVFHPDTVEDVTPKVVEGFFEVFGNRRSPKTSPSKPSGTASRRDCYEARFRTRAATAPVCVAPG
jgi:hypothetical protein